MAQDNWQSKSILHFFEIKINVFIKIIILMNHDLKNLNHKYYKTLRPELNP